MKKRTDLMIGFSSFLFLALFVFFLSRSLGTSYVQTVSRTIFNPWQQGVYEWIARADATTEQEESLLNKRLQLVNIKELERDNRALRDQFAVVDPAPQQLLPAKIVGARSFIPGESLPQAIIVAVGKKNKVKVNHAVIYKNNVVGKISKTFDYFSEVSLITNPDTSLTAVTQETRALGIVTGGTGGKILLTNVQVASKLEEKDIVLTKGDMEPDGTGYPPNLVIGEVEHVNKKASELFQNAEIRSFVDVTRLPMVFVFVQ